MKDRFTPRFHFCEKGNHFHLLTGPNFGASPAFVSVQAGEIIIDSAVDKKDGQDVARATRLKQELRALRLRRRWQQGRLHTRLKRMERFSIPHWSDFINDRLPYRYRAALHFFIKMPCDFVGVCMPDPWMVVVRVKKVQEVLKKVAVRLVTTE
ncbi:MAG: hypothetical protein WD896_02505 [Parcubacteria group bacterium]